RDASGAGGASHRAARGHLAAAARQCHALWGDGRPAGPRHILHPPGPHRGGGAGFAGDRSASSAVRRCYTPRVPSHQAASDTTAAQPRRSSKWSPTRRALAIAVNEGFTAAMLGKKLVSTTYRLLSSWALQLTSSTDVAGSVPKRHVPVWCPTPAIGMCL